MDSIKAKTGSLFKGNNTKVSMILTPPQYRVDQSSAVK